MQAPRQRRFRDFLDPLVIPFGLMLWWIICAAPAYAAPRAKVRESSDSKASGVVSKPTMGTAETLCGFDRPFQYSFLSWEGRVMVVGGMAILKDLGTQGGAGAPKSMDLTPRADHSPVLKLRTGRGNTAKTLLFHLQDKSQTVATWIFPLPAPSSAFNFVLPIDSAPLAKPNRIEKTEGANIERSAAVFDLSQITGFQLLGDWMPGTLDVEVEAVSSMPPDTRMLEQRQAAAKAETENVSRLAQQAAAEVARQATRRQEMVRRYGTRSARSPEVIHVAPVAADIVAMVIDAQRVVPVAFSKYVPRDGDVKRMEKAQTGRPFPMAKLVRGGKPVGWLQGKDLQWFSSFETLEGDPLLDFLADDPANYEIASPDDPAYSQARRPSVVFRKTMPTDWLMPDNSFPTRHRVYLKLPQALSPGKSYTVSIKAVNIRNPGVRFTHDPRHLRSEAVHVNQIGFRPDDPGKRAFLSIWLGTGGALTYPTGLRFSIVDEASDTDVFTGPVELALTVDGRELFAGKELANTSKTPVYRMDFGALATPGRYRVHVDGIGCSYPFEIGRAAWEKAFLVQMRGLFHNRGGTALGEPYTKFTKPRDFLPDDGATITRSRYDVLTNGDQAFEDIAKGDTGEPVKDAWGGYHDAGDWNPRRVSHMTATMAQLELVELFPGYFNALKLNIPPEPGVPDIITEALFEIDCFRRLQLPDGGIPFGIETNGDPIPGEISWLSCQHAYVLSPNIRDSWHYAAVAARAAKVLKPFKPERAAEYLKSAERAFAWAEADYAKRKANGSLQSLRDVWRAIDNRNLAALVLYDATGDARWHKIFLEDTQLTNSDPETNWYEKWIQCDAAFLYARLGYGKADPAIKRHALVAVEKQARRSLDFASHNAFALTHIDKYRPLFGGFFSTSGGTELARAHFLTRKPEYLAGAVRSCLFQSGCNPNNIVYTTGLGTNPIRHPLHVDSRNTGQPPPEGLTSFGNLDYWKNKGGFWDWPLTFINKPETCWPSAYAWPLTEAYFDVYWFVSTNEFVIDTWTPNIFVWGYLAARE